MIVMVARSLDLDALAVEKETIVFVECDGANTERRLDPIAANARYESVQMRRFQRPQLGISNLERLDDPPLLMWLQADRVRHADVSDSRCDGRVHCCVAV